MPVQAFTLMDQSQGIYVDQWEKHGADFGRSTEASVSKRRLRGGLSDGVDVIEVDNGEFRFTVVPTRGMGIWKAWHGDIELGWKSPIRGPVHPQHVPLFEPTGLGWLDGFDELVCRCGLVSNGAPEFDDTNKLTYPLHGRIANRPANRVEVQIEGDEIVIIGVVEETRFHFTKLRLTTTIRTRIGEPGFRIQDHIENFSASEAESQILYHINFGAPLLSAGAELVLPYKQIVPRNDFSAEGIGHWSTYAAPVAGTPERVYFFELAGDANGDTQVLLKQADGQKGVCLGFNTKQLPCFSQWKNETAIEDGYVTGIEPGTNFPNPRSFEGKHNRFVKLGPGEHFSTELSLSMQDSEGIRKTESHILNLQNGVTPMVHSSPLAEWCAP